MANGKWWARFDFPPAKRPPCLVAPNANSSGQRGALDLDLPACCLAGATATEWTHCRYPPGPTHPPHLAEAGSDTRPVAGSPEERVCRWAT
jgi:hypothetical protein